MNEENKLTVIAAQRHLHPLGENSMKEPNIFLHQLTSASAAPNVIFYNANNGTVEGIGSVVGDGHG